MVRKNAKEGEKYNLDEAIALLKEFSNLKFDSSADLIFRLGIDASKGEQTVKGIVCFHMAQEKLKVLVFAKGEKEKEANDSS